MVKNFISKVSQMQKTAGEKISGFGFIQDKWQHKEHGNTTGLGSTTDNLTKTKLKTLLKIQTKLTRG